MKPPLPLCCDASAFRSFSAALPKIETTDGLVRAAVALSRDQPTGILATTQTALAAHAQVVRERVRGTQQQALLAHLHDYLFDELGFAGNGNDYYCPLNSYLPSVLETKMGLPITLSLVYKAVAEKLGQTVRGVGLPGHFIAAIETDTGIMHVDCFAGGKIITEDESRERVESIFGDTVEWQDEMLKPVTNRMWVSRIIQNLMHVFTTNQQWKSVAAMLELQMALWPKQTQLQRDLGLVLARVDMPQPAGQWLDEYLRTNPDDPEREDLVDIRSKLAP